MINLRIDDHGIDMKKETESKPFHRLSLSIETLRFPLIVFIICLHCYTSTSSLIIGHDYYFRIIYPLTLWLGETAVPTYFFISGLLFFYSQKSYSQKLKNRVRTLLFPYLFFNSFVLFGYLCLMFMGKQVVILGNNLADYSWFDYIRAYWDRGVWSHGNGSPILCPFWYIRNLILLVIISPILYYLIRYTRLTFPFVVGFLWINSHDSAYTLQSLTMYSLGAYFPICNRNPIEVFDKYSSIFVGAFLFLAAMDFLHLFIIVPFPLPFHRLSLVANTLFLICFFGIFLYRHHLYSSFLSKSAFFIFCIHYPFTVLLKPLFIRLNGMSDLILVGSFLISLICLIIICLIIYKSLISLVPRFLNMITGNRV